jgi:methyl-accepting chemotaxis protein
LPSWRSVQSFDLHGHFDAAASFCTTLNEVVQSIRDVAGIISEIASASLEQSGGVEQINKALNQMDEITQ